MDSTVLLEDREKSATKVVPYRGTGKEIPLLYTIERDELEDFIGYVKEVEEKVYTCGKVGLAQDGKEYSFEDLGRLEGTVRVFADAVIIEHKEGDSRFETIIARRASWTEANNCARAITRDLIHLLKGKF